MRSSIKIRPLVPSHPRGIVDTSVIIDLDRIHTDHLPTELAVSALTLAELAAGPHATSDPAERARRQHRLQQAEGGFDAIAFDTQAARAYGLVCAQLASAGRKARGRRAIDLMIAATAMAHGLPLFTRNPADVDGLGDLLEIVPVPIRA